MLSLSELLVTCTGLRSSFTITAGLFSILFRVNAGQVDSSFLGKVGSYIHTSLSARLLAERPLVGKSGRFSVPGMCRHCSGLAVL